MQVPILEEIKRFVVAIFLIMFITACRWESSYPSQLVEADSLLMRGEYDAVDSVLNCYDLYNPNNREEFLRYRQLLQLGRRFVDEELSETDYSVVDSLCRYYDNNRSLDKYGKALCFLGEVYKVSGDFPSALNYLLEGIKVAKECGDSYLLGWLYRQVGDLYFDQRMLDECTAYYRNYYNIAVAHKDTLRMAMASFEMGRVHTIYGNVDSIIYHYRKAMEYGSLSKRPENIVPFARYQLGDIYIQIEDYEAAKRYMSYDSLNQFNWAYWHLGQNHLDSAVWYFERTQYRDNLLGQAETYLNLAQLQESKKNITKALSYYKKTLSIEDSIKRLSQVAETKRTNAQFNLNLIKKERDAIAGQNSFMKILVLVVLGVGLIGCILGYYIWEYHKQKRDKELAHEKLLRQLEEDRNRRSNRQIEENKKTISELEHQLAEAKRHNDVETATKLELDAEQLKAENLNIEANQRRHQFLMDEFQKSTLYIKIKKHAGEEHFHLTDDEWETLSEGIDRVYNKFTHRLFMLVQLSDVELKTCYLIKLKVAPVDIATMLFKSKTAISMLRQRLYEKITQQKGTAKQLDEFILNF